MGKIFQHVFGKLETSVFALFIADHFLSNAYFCRFSFATEDESLSPSCLCGYDLETRDRLSFDCELFEVEGEQSYVGIYSHALSQSAKYRREY